MQSHGWSALVSSALKATRHAIGLLVVLATCASPAQAGFDISRIDPGTMAGGLSFVIFCLLLVSDLPSGRRRR
jgi:hypothetical protein